MKNNLFKVLISFLIFLIIFSLGGCFLKPAPKEIDISAATEISSLEQWAVITIAYASFKEDAGNQFDIIAHGKQGDVHQILGNKIIGADKEKELWYEFQEGWLPQNAIRVFSNKLQAEFFKEKSKQK